MSTNAERHRNPWLPWLPSLLVLWALVPGLARAAEFRSGDVVQVGPQEVIDEDLYAFGRVVNIQGTVRGDVIAMGREVDISGTVEGDVMSAASVNRISTPVRGSLRAAGGELSVSGPVGEDAMLAAGNLSLTPEARVGKDLYLLSGDARLYAPVQGELRAAAGTLTLAAPVGQDAHAEVGTLRLTDGARVGGNLSYRSDKDAQLASGAVVSGTVEHLAPRQEKGGGPAMGLYLWLRSLVGLFALGLLFSLLTPRFAHRVTAMLRQRPLPSLGLGAAFFVSVPFLAGLVFLVGLLLGGWWIGLFILALYGFAIALSFPVVGLFLGRWLLERFHKTGAHLAVALLLGLVLLTLVGRVPILGGLVALATILFGLGALLLGVLRGREPAGAPV
ncbi:MAG TPA: polymer-forming cytoskeletal protein [Archangium sp.]|uniref:polymer-forming cytoskeletal protein n=1 Tax=Archangium sp. TaxID=1872627 RepID=UPI002E306780|nr:polymer-forming cytoskeletal protein [Archangium sp.]HEX5751165.1 polymer-forming cytoskeletal protein [Archangium sp.]